MKAATRGEAMEEQRRLIERLQQQLHETGALLLGDFTLSSGAKSAYYFDGKMVALDPEGCHLLGQLILALVRDTDVKVVGGLELGAIPIATCVAQASFESGEPIPAFIVRKEPKLHGTEKRIEGHLPSGAGVVIVDDVITKGGSIRDAIDAVEAAGCRVVKVVVILDRHEGGSDKLRADGYTVEAIFGSTPEGTLHTEYPGVERSFATVR